MDVETSRSALSNEEIAGLLDRVADLLQAQEANPFRIRAYQNAAHEVRKLDHSLAEAIEQEGREGLERVPGIGKSLASSILEYVRTGRLRFLDRLEGEIAPQDLFKTIPGVGPRLAQRIHDQLDIDTLEDLETAAHDGRLEGVRGVGRRRIQAIRNELNAMLSRSARRRARRFERPHAGGQEEESPEPPSVETILGVDREYRRRAEEGELRKIAPRRFNPEGKAWLPIWHADRQGWHFTALYSNTALAHRRGTTHDWVVLFYERDGLEEQCTVVTEKRGGPLQGRRVIRGREAECREYCESTAGTGNR
jgi:DNA polymerase (family 10)